MILKHIHKIKISSSKQGLIFVQGRANCFTVTVRKWTLELCEAVYPFTVITGQK